LHSGSTNSVGLTEDHWSNANSPTSVPANGVRVKIGTATFDTNASGCVTFPTAQPWAVYDVRVYAYASDDNDNFVRIHNGAEDTTASYPGATYSLLTTGVYFDAGGATTLQVGSHTPRWTAMGALAFSLGRYHDGVTDTAYHVSESVPDNCGSNVNYSNNVTANWSYIRLQNGSCSGTDARTKFVIAHEYGHAYLFQYANKSGQSPGSQNHDVLPSDCAFDSPGGGSAYYNNTNEWSSLAVREGFAHFVSARVWNDAAADGNFQWDGSFDLERWNSSNTPGGHLVNVCCPGISFACASSLNGAGTITDWMRALWDTHTDSSCSLTKGQMALFYTLIIIDSGLTDANFWSISQGEMSLFGSTCSQRWDAHGCHNGIDREGAIWFGC
jgi:hypothetical protein